MSYLREHDEHTRARGGYGMDVLYLESTLGVLCVLACDQCPYLEAHCEHKENSWNADGTQLTCNLCGADGT